MMRTRRWTWISLTLLGANVLFGGCGRARRVDLPAPIPRVDQPLQTAFALRMVEVAVGSGAAVVPRQCVYAHYTGWLVNGTKFDSSRDTMPNGRPRSPLAFPLGVRRVIAGWDLGFEGMRVGGRRRLLIPYQLAYGETGRPPVIPPRAELVFDVELLAVADTVPTAAAVARPDSAPRRPAPAGPQCPSWQTVSGAGE
jgi:peptidylprolyl isomerase